MNYYLKFHMYGSLNLDNYLNIDTINLYSNGEFIPVTKDNIVSHDFKYRTGNLELIFSNQSIGGKPTPYGSNKDGYSDLIIRLDTKIDKIDLVSYQNEGTCRFVDICQSTDNINYTLLKTIKFSKPSEKVTLENLKIKFNYYLIYENSRYYNIKNENYDILEKKYSNIPFSNDLVTIIKENYIPSLSELSEEKNISGETFKPLDKFSNFKIKKLVK